MQDGHLQYWRISLPLLRGAPFDVGRMETHRTLGMALVGLASWAAASVVASEARDVGIAVPKRGDLVRCPIFDTLRVLPMSTALRVARIEEDCPLLLSA